MVNPVDLANRDYRTFRRLMAKKLGIPEARNVKERGLYVFSYGDHYMVRIYSRAREPQDLSRDDKLCRLIFEEKAPREGFPTDELLTKLMLVAR